MEENVMSHEFKKTIVIIVPVYNEAESIEAFFERLSRSLITICTKYFVRVLFVNNASTDPTLSKILELKSDQFQIGVITHSRNFGYQASVISGLSNSSGDAFIIIDVDCEDPPELLSEFVTGWEDGFDVVYGERLGRPESKYIIFMRRLFYRVTKMIGDWEIILDMAEFALFTDRVRKEVIKHYSTYPYIRGEISYAGYSRKKIPYNRQKRLAGKTHYNFIQMAQFAAAGIFTSSTFPLRFIAYLGIPLSIINLFLILLTLVVASEKFFKLCVLLDFSFILMAISFIAVYISRLYKDSVGRPIFIIDEKKSYNLFK